MVNTTTIEKIENAVKVILKRTTPQAFLLFLYMWFTPDNFVLIIGELVINKFGMSFIVLISIGLCFSEVGAERDKYKAEAEALQKQVLDLTFQIKTYEELGIIQQKLEEKKVEEKAADKPK